MIRKLIIALFALAICAPSYGATQAVIIDSSTKEIQQTAVKLPNGMTLTANSGSAFTLNSGSTVTINGTLAGSAFGTGMITWLGTPTSANLRSALTDETGTGALVFAGGNIGAATATSLNSLTITTSTGTLTITNGKTLAVTNTITLAGTDAATYTMPKVSSYVQGEDNRPMHVYKVENQTMSAGGSYTILDVPAGTAGTVEFIQLAIAGANTATTSDTQLQIRANRVAAPGEYSDLGMFYSIHFRNKAYHTTWMSNGSDVTTTQMGAFRKVEIPFTNGILITIASGSGSVDGQVYSQVKWREGVDPNQGNRRHFHMNYIHNQAVAQDATIDLLPTVSDVGEIDAVQLLIFSADNYGFFEGNVDWALDGATQSWGGTEDYFLGTYYFGGDPGGGYVGGARPFVADDAGVFFRDALAGGGSETYVTFLYRKHRQFCPITFATSAKLTWHNGDTTAGQPNPGDVQVFGLVTYWTQN